MCAALVLFGVYLLVTATEMRGQWPGHWQSVAFGVGVACVLYPLIRLAVAASGRKFPGKKW